MPNITSLGIVKDGVKGLPLNLSNARKKTWSQIQQMTTAEKKGVIICEDIPLGQKMRIDSDEVAYGNGSVKGALDELNADTVRLWQNSEIDSQGNLTYFSSQKISIPTLQNYKYIKIVHSNYAKKNQQIQTFINKSAYGGLLFNSTGLNQANYYIYVQSRLFIIENDGITFNDGISSNISASVNQNAYCIPLEIWGCNKP